MTQNMTVRDLQGATLTGRSDRLANEVLSEGLLAVGNEFQVVQQSSPNMTVRVGSGVAGDRYVVPIAGRGTYIVHNRTDTYVGSGNTDVPISNGDPTNPRIDGIDLRVRDNEFDSSGFNDATIIVTQGTPGGVPAAPAIPSGCVRLATILVPANRSTNIGTGDISDLRKRSVATGGRLVCTSGTRPASPFSGQDIFETDTLKELHWNGSVWVIDFQPMTTFAVVRRGGGVADTIGTGGQVNSGRYTIIGGVCFFTIQWQFGSAGAVATAGVTTFDLPVAFNASSDAFQPLGSGAGFQAGARFNYQVLRDASNTGASLFSPGQVTSTQPGNVTFSDSYFFSGSYRV